MSLNNLYLGGCPSSGYLFPTPGTIPAYFTIPGECYGVCRLFTSLVRFLRCELPMIVQITTNVDVSGNIWAGE